MNKDALTPDLSELHFEPSAYLQRLLGRELVSNDYLAIAELVKNAYDAGATLVTIALESGESQVITVTDNGCGMSTEEFRKFWMRPGYSEKDNHKGGDRPLLGEKGIGRFAVDKLAAKLTIVTKKVADNEALKVVFDWSEFDDRTKSMRDIAIPISHENNEALANLVSGTILKLDGLRTVWDKSKWRLLRKQLQTFITPFRTSRQFRIIADYSGWPAGSGEVNSVFETQIGYKYTFRITQDGRFASRLVRPKRVANGSENAAKEYRGRKPSPSFGPVQGTFYYVDSPRSLIAKQFVPGIGLYRDGFRVEPYGNKDNDWLGVQSLKARRQGHAPISPPRLFGFVSISGWANPNLKDVTNREGLLDTPEFKEFLDFIRNEFSSFADAVDETEKDTPDSKAIEAQRASLARPIKQATISDLASQLAHQLRQPLQVIQTSADTLESLINNGKLLDEAKLKRITEKIKRNVEDLNDHISLIRERASASRSPAEQFELNSWLRSKLEAMPEVHEGKIIHHRFTGDGELNVSFNKKALGFAVSNLLENALQAVARSDSESIEITVQAARSKGSQYSYCVSVQDNGDGVPEQLRSTLLKQYVPSNTNGTGGGLFYSHDVIEENGGEMSFEDAVPSGSIFRIYFKDQEAKNA